MLKNRGRRYLPHSSSRKRCIIRIFREGITELLHTFCKMALFEKPESQGLYGVDYPTTKGGWGHGTKVMGHGTKVMGHGFSSTIPLKRHLFVIAILNTEKNLSQLSCQRAHNYHKIFERINHLIQFHTICQTF